MVYYVGPLQGGVCLNGCGGIAQKPNQIDDEQMNRERVGRGTAGAIMCKNTGSKCI